MSIYAKLDWYSVMLYNKNVEFILEKLNITDDVSLDLFDSLRLCDKGMWDEFVYNAHGIHISYRYSDFLKIPENERCHSFITVVAKIRLDISGSGLDYLRSVIDIDAALQDINFWSSDPHDFNVTRCDFAFDFVNSRDEEFKSLFEYLKDCDRKDIDRVSVGRPGGIKYSLKCGDQQTIYLGSTNGDRLLRIYNKRLQRPDITDSPFDETSITSWWRIELQTRRKKAYDCLFSDKSDLSQVLRYVFDNFAITEQGTTTVLPCVLSLTDWSTLPPIIQNRNYGEYKTVSERASNRLFGQDFSTLVCYLALFGRSHLISNINMELHSLHARAQYGDYVAIQRFSRLIYKLDIMAHEEGKKSIYDLKHIKYDSHGVLTLI